LPGNDASTAELTGHARMTATNDLKTPLIEKAIRMAARNYALPSSAIFHSARGSNPGFNRSSQRRLIGVRVAVR
jgi:hypothetical protein